MTSHLPAAGLVSPLEGVVSGQFCEVIPFLACVTTRGRRHVQHDSLFLPARIPLTIFAFSLQLPELPDNFIDLLPDTEQRAGY